MDESYSVKWHTRHVSVSSPLSSDHPLVTGITSNSPVISAYRGVRQARRPIWLMRQAGRSLPEYRAIRAGVPMLEACLRPEMAAEITLQPVRRHHVDAGIFFSDIVVPLKLAGIDVDIVSGTGPVISNPIRRRKDLDALTEIDSAAFDPISEAVRLATEQLGTTPLIGFAGAPFTLASYLIEGRPSRSLPVTRAMMLNEPVLWHSLLSWVARATAAFLRAQILAGASAVQLFDSWAGSLSLNEYETLAAPHSRTVMEAISDLPVPRVHFGTKTGGMLDAMRDVGANVVGVDYLTPLDLANARLGGTVPLQGNIDPRLLSAPWADLSAHTTDVMRRGESAPAHVVNLGHGVPPDTDPDVLTRLVAFVHGDLDAE